MEHRYSSPIHAVTYHRRFSDALNNFYQLVKEERLRKRLAKSKGIRL